MAKLWCSQILCGARSLSQVPRLLMDAVRAQLALQGWTEEADA